MSYYQVRIKNAGSETTRREMAEHGIVGEHWLLVDDAWVERMFDLDEGDIKRAIDHWGGECYMLCVEIEGAAEVYVREVAPLVRQGNGDKGFIVPDDIAIQMTSEFWALREGSMDPEDPNALNWFAEEVERFPER